MFSFDRCVLLLAQVTDLAPEAPAASPRRGMNFSDLQQGLRAANHTTSHDRSAQGTLVLIIAIIITLGIMLNLRQRRKQAGPPSGPGRLGWELSRCVKFPFGSRMMMLWVAWTVKMPAATLLLSAAVFDAAVTIWAQQPTFTPIRHWGHSRLLLLKPRLFD